VFTAETFRYRHLCDKHGYTNNDILHYFVVAIASLGQFFKTRITLFDENKGKICTKKDRYFEHELLVILLMLYKSFSFTQEFFEKI